MPAWLLLYDPSVYSWKELPQLAEQSLRGRTVVSAWECGKNRRMRKGDRVFFLRKGREPFGIFAAGHVARVPREETGQVPGTMPGDRALVVDVRFDALGDGNRAVTLPLLDLQREFPSFQWSQRESAAQPLPPAVLDKLEDVFRIRHEAVIEEAEKTLPPSARKAPPAPEADAVRLALVGAWFSLFAGVARGEDADPGAIAQPVRALAAKREPDFDLDQGFSQVATLALQAGLPIHDRFPPRDVTDEKIHVAFDAFRRKYASLLETLKASVHRAMPPRWPHVDDFRLYWIAPPSPGDMPRMLTHARELEPVCLAANESLSESWHRCCVDFALAYENARLWQNGQREFAARVQRAERAGYGGEGWDLLSFEDDGSPRKIIVKGTRFGRRQPFLLCGSELEAARDPDASVYVYRLFDALVSPRFFIVQSRLQQKEIGAKQDATGIRLLEWSRVNLRSPWLLREKPNEAPEVLYEYFV